VNSFIKQKEDSLRNLEGQTMRGFHRTRIFRGRGMSFFHETIVETNEKPIEGNFEKAQWTRVVMTQRTELFRKTNAGTIESLTKVKL
jgi:hypothetical protein